MNTYEAYKKIKGYFSKPGAVLAKDYDNFGNTMSCHYRAPDGHKCAVGCLVPKALYIPDIEGKGATEALYELQDVNPKLYEATFGDVNLAFLEAAQQAHDEARTVEAFLAQLEYEATYYGLVDSEPAFTAAQEESGEADWERRTRRDNI